MKKILLFSDTKMIGGHETMTSRIANELAIDNDLEVTVIGTSKLKKLLSDKITFLNCPVEPKMLAGSIGLFFILDYIKIIRILIFTKPSVLIVSQGTIELGIKAVLVARLLGIPVISYLPMVTWLKITKSRWFPTLRDGINKYLYRLPDAFITISNGIAKEIAELSRKPGSVFVIHNYLERQKEPNVSVSLKESINKKLSEVKKSGKVIVGLFGRLEFKHKQQDLFLKFWKNNFHDEKFYFVIAGNGPHLVALEKIIDEYELNNSVIALGHVNNIIPLYDFIDILIIPSSHEGVPLVALEAILNKKKIVSFDFLGLRDYLHPNSLIEANNFKLFCEAIVDASNCSELTKYRMIPTDYINSQELKNILNLFNSFEK